MLPCMLLPDTEANDTDIDMNKNNERRSSEEDEENLLAARRASGQRRRLSLLPEEGILPI